MAEQRPVVWIIDSEHWPRALLRAELIERGLDAVGYETYGDAIDTLPWRRTDAIVVEVRGQPVGQVERLLHVVPSVILTGGSPDIDDAAYADNSRWTAVLRRPVSIGEIADAVLRAIRERPDR